MNSISVLAILVIGSVALAACATAKRNKSMPLPASCSLPSLTPAERQKQEERCDHIRRAAFDTKDTAKGFTFKVKLRKMSLEALNEWARNEQNCCSFLQIHTRVLTAGKVAEVRVSCPPELKAETMTTFGLRSGT